MPAKLLSVLIPARNEMFLARTIENILENMEGDTEIIAVADGYDPGILPDDPRVRVIYKDVSLGQRGATNEAARASEAKYVMKADAHCAFDKGFDVKLAEKCEHDWTIVPKMYNLHGFDWMCKSCGDRTYQGPIPKECAKCKSTLGFEMVVVWQPRWNRLTWSWRFDKEMHFQYWRKHRKRRETKRGEFIETMSFVGACWFTERSRYWELDGLDENHGSWGQVGTEIACKSWLSGGKLLTAKNTWFSHMFRTRKDFGFPYPISGNQQERAKIYSRDLWLNDKWPKAIHPLSWLVEKFKPVPDWHEGAE